MIRTQVIVVGAGPVGTVAASLLAQNGIEVLVLEKNGSCEDDMRASTFHAPTIAMLHQIGVAEPLIADGLKAPLFQYRIRATDEVLEFDLTELADELEFPFRLQCEQFKLARLLASNLERDSNVQVLFNHSVRSVSQERGCVRLEAETPEGTLICEADYLIAADGAKSLIRRELNAQFPGFTYREKFLTLSTEAALEDYFENLCYVNYVSDPEEWYVLLKVPTAWRILIPATEHDSDELLLSDERKDALFEGLLGSRADISTAHRTIYRVHQRVVEKMNHGRIVLAGDAAHLNNPLGGFGMNGGIHDAWNLGHKLIAILKKNASPTELLNRYDRQRRAIMYEFVQAQTIRNKKMIEESGDSSNAREWDEMRAIHKNAARRRRYMLRQSMVQSLYDEAEIA